MSRKLILLNLVLASLAAYAAWQIRLRSTRSDVHHSGVLHQQTPALPAPPLAPAPVVEPLQASSYLEVAEKLLFTRDRNPAVVIEKPAEKPVPPFPVAHGVMDFGSGATVILSEKSGADQKSYRKGDKIGPFQLASVTAKEVVFEWDGKQFPKAIDDLKFKEAPQASGTAALPAAPARDGNLPAPPTTYTITAQKVVEEAQKPKGGGPGLEVGSTIRACAPGDTSPPGTIQAGFRKVVSATPFGNSCRWEPIR